MLIITDLNAQWITCKRVCNQKDLKELNRYYPIPNTCKHLRITPQPKIYNHEYTIDNAKTIPVAIKNGCIKFRMSDLMQFDLDNLNYLHIRYLQADGTFFKFADNLFVQDIKEMQRIMDLV